MQFGLPWGADRVACSSVAHQVHPCVERNTVSRLECWQHQKEFRRKLLTQGPLLLCACDGRWARILGVAHAHQGAGSCSRMLSTGLVEGGMPEWQPACAWSRMRTVSGRACVAPYYCTNWHLRSFPLDGICGQRANGTPPVLHRSHPVRTKEEERRTLLISAEYRACSGEMRCQERGEEQHP